MTRIIFTKVNWREVNEVVQDVVFICFPDVLFFALLRRYQSETRKVASVQAAYSRFFETESGRWPCGILWLVMASGMRPCGILQLVMACSKQPSSRLWLVRDSGKRPCGIPLLIPKSRNGAQQWSVKQVK